MELFGLHDTKLQTYLGVVISTVDANLRAIFRPEVFVYFNRKVYQAKSYFRTYQQLLSIFSIE